MSTSRSLELAAAAIMGGAVAILALTDARGAGPGFVDAAARLLPWAAVLLSAATLAARLTRSSLGGLAHLAWDGAAGLACVMGLLVAVGQLPSGFRRSTLIAATAALAVAALVIVAWRRPRLAEHHSSRTLLGSSCVALAVVAAIGIVWDRVPPVFFDSLAYHFAQPNLWLVEGRLAPEPWSLHSWFPPGMSALYGLGMAWGGDSAASDANLICGILLLALVMDLAWRLAGAAAGWVAFGLAATAPILIHALGIPAADLGHGLMSFGCLGGWLLWRKTGEQSWAHRSALFAAGAALTKYLGLLVPVGLGAVLFTFLPPEGRERSLSASIRRALAFGLPTLLLLAGWGWANMRVTGNPVAPVLSDVLQTRGLAEGARAAFRADARGGLPGTDDVKQLWRTLFAGNPSPGIYPTPAWGFAPLLFLLGLGLWPWARRNRDVRTLLALAGGSFAFWFLTYRWERFLVATTALGAVALGVAIAASWSRGALPRLVTVAGALLALGGAARAVFSVLAFTGGAGVALGRETPSDLVERAFAYVGLVRAAADSLPPQSRLLLVGETRHHWIDLPHAAPSVFNAHPLAEALESAEDALGVSARLREQGYSHLLVDPRWIERSAARYPSLAFVRARPERLRAYLASLGRPVAEHRGVALFAVPERGR